MSYDLFFYKKQDSQVTEQTIRTYLTENLTKPNEQNNQWWFENEDTGVYFSFETTDKNDYEDFDQLFESFDEFENTRFLFNLNFIRPDFFGRESFAFVEKFIKDLNLYTLNPQSENCPDMPYKPQPNELHANWTITNNTAIKDNFSKKDCYYPLAETNEIWNHNFNKWNLQAKYDEEYYVPKIYLIEQYKTKKIVTQTSWVKHIPNIFPKADYILMLRDKKTMFKTVEESGFISYDTFIKTFGDLLNDIDIPGYKIIHPENAEKASNLFNTVKFDVKVSKLGERISWDSVYNVKPD